MFPRRNLDGRSSRRSTRRLIGAAPRAPQAVERELAIMFTDIAGFTELAESLPPGAVARLLTAHFRALTRCIGRERGTVGKILGDGLLAFWHGGAAASAVRAALGIREAVASANRARHRTGLPEIRVRVGLHAGPLVMARLGPGRAPGLTPLGDTVNVAQRLEDAARHVADGAEVTVLASEAIVERVGPAFRFEPLGSLAVRGRQEPIRAFRLA